jgi:hypothetical protein
MKKLITSSLVVGFAVASGFIFAQSIGDVSIRGFFRSVTLNASRTDQVNTIWDIIDAKKTNTTLTAIHITRNGTNNCVIVAEEQVQVKIVEN